jgi:hypothetical protein
MLLAQEREQDECVQVAHHQVLDERMIDPDVTADPEPVFALLGFVPSVFAPLDDLGIDLRIRPGLGHHLVHLPRDGDQVRSCSCLS